MNPNRLASIEAIKKHYESALGYGLELEVIVEALLAMQETPSLSPEEAFEIGCSSWDVHMLDLDQDIDNINNQS